MLKGWTLIFALYGIIHPTHREVVHTAFYKNHYEKSKEGHFWMIVLWSIGIAAWAISAGLFAYKCETKDNYDVVLGLQLTNIFVVQIWTYLIPQKDKISDKEISSAYMWMSVEFWLAMLISVPVLILMAVQSDWIPIIPWVVFMIVLGIAYFLFWRQKTKVLSKNAS